MKQILLIGAAALALLAGCAPGSSPSTHAESADESTDAGAGREATAPTGDGGLADTTNVGPDGTTPGHASDAGTPPDASPSTGDDASADATPPNADGSNGAHSGATPDANNPPDGPVADSSAPADASVTPNDASDAPTDSPVDATDSARNSADSTVDAPTDAGAESTGWVWATIDCDFGLVNPSGSTSQYGFSAPGAVAFQQGCGPDGCQGPAYAELTAPTLFDVEGSQNYSQQVASMSFSGSYWAENSDALEEVTTSQLGIAVGYLNDGSLHSPNAGITGLPALFNANGTWNSYCYVTTESVATGSLCYCNSLAPDGGSDFQIEEITFAQGVASQAAVNAGTTYGAQSDCQAALNALPRCN